MVQTGTNDLESDPFGKYSIFQTRLRVKYWNRSIFFWFEVQTKIKVVQKMLNHVKISKTRFRKSVAKFSEVS